jgi:transposase
VDENVVNAAHAAQSTRVAPLTFSSSGPGRTVDRLFTVPRNARPRWALLTSSGFLLPGLPYTVTLSPGISISAFSHNARRTSDKGWYPPGVVSSISVRPPRFEAVTGVPPSFRTADRLRSIPKGEEFMSGKYPKYSPEFRVEAAKMVVEGSRAIAQVAREYGLSETTLGNWVRVYREKHASDEPPLELSERARLRELERQNRELEMENAFLKKAAAYFAREPR